MNMVASPGQTTGPVCVCDEFSSRRARSIPNCRARPLRHLLRHLGGQSDHVRGHDHHASARPVASIASARAQSCWRTALGRMIAAGIARHPDGLARRNVHARHAGAQPGRPSERRRGPAEIPGGSHPRTIAGYTLRIAATASSRIALRVLGAHHHSREAAQDIDGARAALAAVAYGLAALAG